MLSQLELEARYAGGARLRPPILCTLIMPMKSSNAVAWHKKGTSLLKSPVPNELLFGDGGNEGVGPGCYDVVDLRLQLLVDRYGSLAGGGERGSAGTVALDEFAAQLAFCLVHNAPGFGIRHAHALGGTVERVFAGDTLQQQDTAVAEDARQILVARLNDQLCRRLVLHLLHVSPLKCLLGKRKACVKPSCALLSCALLKSCIVAVKVR